jgi:hypothetical protein
MPEMRQHRQRSTPDTSLTGTEEGYPVNCLERPLGVGGPSFAASETVRLHRRHYPQ